MKTLLSIHVFLAWYDCWVGVYYDRKTRHLYLCPLPMIVFEIWRGVDREEARRR